MGVYSVNTNVPITTLCDGFPRALRPFKTIVTSTRSTPSPQTYATQYISKSYNKPPPTCTINEKDCIPYAKAWSSSYSAWSSDQNNPYPTETLHCSTYYPCPTVTGEQDCKLYVADATVYYWPTATTGDFCATPRSILTRRASNVPKSTVIAGTTFVSPTAYIKYGSASAKRHLGPYTATSCGYGRHNLFLNFPGGASQINTRVWKPGTATNTHTLDALDLNTPFPASAYFIRGTPTSCITTGCPTIEPTKTPVLDTPKKLTEKDPEWKFCTPRSEGIADATWIALEPNPPNYPKATKTPRAVFLDE